MFPLNTIYKIGALIFNEDNQLLAVHKKGKPPLELIMPGGCMEDGENDEQTLRRELLEELGTEIISFQFYGQFEGKAIYEDKWLIMRTYTVILSGLPHPNNEIDGLVWLGHDYQNNNYQLASILGKQILPSIFSS